MERPETPTENKIIVCSKCEKENLNGKKYCSQCGFTLGSIFKLPTSNWTLLEPAMKTCGVLFGINLLFLFLKITQKNIHIYIEIFVEILFDSIVIFIVYPSRKKIYFLCRRFYNTYYSPFKIFFIALLTGIGIFCYFKIFELLGIGSINFLERSDLGTARIPLKFIETILLAPVFEEIFFRGYLYQKFSLVLKARETIILQGLLFGIFHLSPAIYISHTMMGVLFGYLRYRTKSLVPSMSLHALWNFIVFGIAFWKLSMN